MKTPAIKRTLLMAGLLSVIVAGLGSCDKDPITGQSKKNMKFTITVTGATNTDYISFVFSGGAPDPTDKTLWKIDGQVQNNQAAVSLDKDDFGAGKTIVVESTKPLVAASVPVQCLQPANDTRTYKVSFKAEIGGDVKQNDQNVSVGYNKDYTHQYSY